jgi:hypothetical protein
MSWMSNGTGEVLPDSLIGMLSSCYGLVVTFLLVRRSVIGLACHSYRFKYWWAEVVHKRGE